MDGGYRMKKLSFWVDKKDLLVKVSPKRLAGYHYIADLNVEDNFDEDNLKTFILMMQYSIETILEITMPELNINDKDLN